MHRIALASAVLTCLASPVAAQAPRPCAPDPAIPDRLASEYGEAVTGGGIDAGVGAILNGTLTQEEAQATFSAGSNQLTITLNSNAEATVTAAYVDTVVSALSEFTSATPTGPTIPLVGSGCAS